MVARPSESRDDHGKRIVEDSRQTRLLAFGLVIAVIVFFQSQVRLALDAAHSFESRVGLALVPSAIILAVVFLLYRVTRRHDASLRAAVTDSVTQERRTRTTELDSLTAFGLSLSRANDIGVIRDLAQDRLLRFSGGRPCWAVMRAKGTWESIVGGVEGAPERVRPEVEQLAEDVLTRLEGAADAPEGSSGGTHLLPAGGRGDDGWGVLTVQTAGPDRDDQNVQDPGAGPWRRPPSWWRPRCRTCESRARLNKTGSTMV